MTCCHKKYPIYGRFSWARSASSSELRLTISDQTGSVGERHGNSRRPEPETLDRIRAVAYPPVVGLAHHGDQLGKLDLVSPTKLGICLFRPSD